MDQTAQTDDTNQTFDEFAKLRQQLKNPDLPLDLAEKLTEQLNRVIKVTKDQGFRVEYDSDLKYIDFVSSLPFNKSTQDILDLNRTSQILDQHHYGLRVVKDRILEYMAMLILNSRQQRKMKSQILAFVGLVGSGKTSLCYSIAEALGRKLIRIPFGGLGSVRELRGESHTRPEAEPGRLLKFIKAEQVNNPVILLDEIDRVATESRSDVMGVLVELLDPEQNSAFVDHYVDYPIDLSSALFIATANNTGNIATAVMDRLELIEMPSYSDEEKITIGKDFILPKAIKEAGLPENLIIIDPSLWPQIVRPLGYDAGIRSLQRNIQGIVRKIARKMVEGNAGPYRLESSNIGQYID